MNNINQKNWGLNPLSHSRIKTSFASSSINTSVLNIKPALTQDTISFTGTDKRKAKSDEDLADLKWYPEPRNSNCNNKKATSGITVAELAKNQNKIIPITGIDKLESSEALRIANQVSIFNLMKHVNALASPEMEGRGVGQKGIEVAKAYIANEFEKLNLEPVEKLGLKDYFQEFTMHGYNTSSEKKGKYIEGDINYYKMAPMAKTSNVLGMIKGSENPDQYMVIVAHYDHLGKDFDKNIYYPGANDDASGVGAMLEIARIMSEEKPPRKSVIFAALSGEEFAHGGAEKLSKELNAAGIGNKSEVLNLEMLGAKSGNKLDIWDEGKKGTESIVNNLVKAGQIFNIPTKIIRKSTPGQDAKEFNSNGIPAVCTAWDFKQKTNHPTYHSAQDTPENINKKVYNKATKIIAAASYLSANQSSNSDTSFTSNSDKKSIQLIA